MTPAAVLSKPLLAALGEAYVTLLHHGDGRAVKPAVEWATAHVGAKETPVHLKMCVAAARSSDTRQRL